MALKVIGAGFGRTGTKSLQLALEQLEIGSCYHMESLLRNPEHVIHWKNAHKRQKVNWNSLFRGYGAAVDFPTAIYYRELAEHFPDAKVILTIRDADAWYDSVARTIYSFDPGIKLKLKMIASLPFSQVSRDLFKVIMLNNKSIWSDLFDGRFKDRDHTLTIYENHIQQVKDHIPAERLLVFKPSDGWDPLCRFLGVPVPNSPFPNTNTSANFHQWAQNIVREVLSGQSS